MTKTTLETTSKPRTDAECAVTPVAPLPATGNGQALPTETPDAAPVPLLPGQQRPSPIGPPIPNHPLAPFIGSFNDEPLWDEWQEAIRAYRQRMNEQQDDEE